MLSCSLCHNLRIYDFYLKVVFSLCLHLFVVFWTVFSCFVYLMVLGPRCIPAACSCSRSGTRPWPTPPPSPSGSQTQKAMVLVLRGGLDGYSEIRKSLLFDLFKTFNQIQSSHKVDQFYPKRPIFLHESAACSELPYDISTMQNIGFNKKRKTGPDKKTKQTKLRI